jgi:hypothetical protein
VYDPGVIPALIIGAFTAWYLGLRAGIFAAVVSAALMVLAMFVPPTALGIYIVLGAYVIALWLFGSRLPALTRTPDQGPTWKAQVGKWAVRARALWK